MVVLALSSVAGGEVQDVNQDPDHCLLPSHPHVSAEQAFEYGFTLRPFLYEADKMISGNVFLCQFHEPLMSCGEASLRRVCGNSIFIISSEDGEKIDYDVISCVRLAKK